MNTLFKASFLSLSLILGAGTQTIAAPLTQPADAADASTETKKSDDKAKTSSSTKQEMRQKRKEERARKLLENSEETLKELEAKLANASDLVKKKATLAIAHAKLELEAAKDGDFAESLSFHARRCKQYLFRAKDILEGKEDKTKAKEESTKA